MGVKVRPFALTGGSGNNPVTAQGVFFSGVQGVALTPQTITPTGGTGIYTFSGGGTLPAGVTIGAATGIISGTPTVAGNVTATITITDSLGIVGTCIAAFTLIQTSFSDAFSGASGRLGANWLLATYPYIPSTASCSPVCDIVTASDAGQGLQWSFGGGNAVPTDFYTGVGCPKPVYTGGVFGGGALQTGGHFAQITWISSVAGAQSNSAGLALCVSLDARAYYLISNNELSNFISVFRVGNGAVTLLGSSGAGTNLAAGDVFRAWAVLTNAAQVDINFSVNAGAPVTITDANAARLYVGSPGIGCRSMGNGSNQQFRTFSCGLGT
jgi:Putative Ig domain